MSAIPGGIKKNPRFATRKLDISWIQWSLIQPRWRNRVKRSIPIILEGSLIPVRNTISSPRAKQPNKMAHWRIIYRLKILTLQSYKKRTFINKKLPIIYVKRQKELIPVHIRCFFFPVLANSLIMRDKRRRLVERYFSYFFILITFYRKIAM